MTVENEIHDKLWKLIMEEVEHGLTKAKPSPSKNEVQESVRKNISKIQDDKHSSRTKSYLYIE
jgi:predicted component of type VI protein secretion system